MFKFFYNTAEDSTCHIDRQSYLMLHMYHGCSLVGGTFLSTLNTGCDVITAAVNGDQNHARLLIYVCLLTFSDVEPGQYMKIAIHN